MMERTEELEYNGKKHNFKFRGLTFGEKNRLIEEATDIKIIGGQQIVKVSVSKLTEGAILKCLIEAPFVINLQNIQALTPELGGQMTAIVNDMNDLSEKKKSESSNSSTDSA